MPMELDSPKRKIIESETRSTFNVMKTIAGDIWRVNIFTQIKLIKISLFKAKRFDLYCIWNHDGFRTYICVEFFA